MYIRDYTVDIFCISMRRAHIYSATFHSQLVLDTSKVINFTVPIIGLCLP